MRSLAFGFGGLLLAMFVAAGIASTGFQRLAMYFPFTVASVGAVLTAIYLALQFRDMQVQRTAESEGTPTASEPPPEIKAALPYLAWFLGYVGAIALVGLVYGTVLFLGGFLWREARMRWWAIGLSLAATVGILHVVSGVMNLHWPRSITGL